MANEFKDYSFETEHSIYTLRVHPIDEESYFLYRIYKDKSTNNIGTDRKGILTKDKFTLRDESLYIDGDYYEISNAHTEALTMKFKQDFSSKADIYQDLYFDFLTNDFDITSNDMKYLKNGFYEKGNLFKMLLDSLGSYYSLEEGKLEVGSMFSNGITEYDTMNQYIDLSNNLIIEEMKKFSN